MKKPLNKVPREKLEEIAGALGATLRVQSGFVQVQVNGRRMYIAKAKECGRVDVCFDPPEGLAGVTRLDEDMRFGKVTHELDFTQPAETTLEAFIGCIEHAKSLPALPVKEQRRAEAPQPATTAAQAQGVVPREPVEAGPGPHIFEDGVLPGEEA